MADQPATPPLISTSSSIVLVALVLVLVGGFVSLIITGHDTNTYTLFVAGPLVTTLVGAILSRRVKVVEAVARTVQEQTNGLLTAKVAGLHTHLTEQTAELAADMDGQSSSHGQK